MRLVIARCSVDYAGRLSAHLPLATRLLLVKADGSVLVHSDALSYKPLNWMSPPCTLAIEEVDSGVRMTIASRFASPEDMARVLEMGMEEGIKSALGQTDDLLGADRG